MTPPVRLIAHIDMDAFFAAVEQLDHPQLRGQPVIVGGPPDSRGVVAACSYEARAFGVHSAMPSGQAVRLCPAAVFLRPRMFRYKEISSKIMAIFRRYTDLVEPLSLDEAYLDLSEQAASEDEAVQLVTEIRQNIARETGLTASAGLGSSKFIAKVASARLKPNGMTHIPAGREQVFIDQLPVAAFPGVGTVTGERMRRLGILTGLHLYQRRREELHQHFGKAGDCFYQLARGIDHRQVCASRPRKSIGCETTFAQDITDPAALLAVLAQLAGSLAATCQRLDCGGYCLTLKVRYHTFQTISRAKTGRILLRSQQEILHQAEQLLPLAGLAGRKIRLLGLSLRHLAAARNQPVQLRLPFMDSAAPITLPVDRGW